MDQDETQLLMMSWMKPVIRKRWVSTFRFQATRNVWSRIFPYNYTKSLSLSRYYWKVLLCSNGKGDCMGMLGWWFLANSCNQRKLQISTGYPKQKPHLQYRKQGLMIHPYCSPFWLKVVSPGSFRTNFTDSAQIVKNIKQINCLFSWQILICIVKLNS